MSISDVASCHWTPSGRGPPRVARMSSLQVVTLIAVTTFSGRQFREGQVGEGRVCVLSHQSQKVKADSDGVLADSNHLTLENFL